MSGAGSSLLGDPTQIPSLLQALGQSAPSAIPQPENAPPPVQAPAPSTTPSGRPMPQPGEIVNYHKFTGGNPADPGAWEPLSGDDFLHELGKSEPTIAVRVKAIADGREPMPSTSRVNPFNRMLANAVAQYDPQGYDSINNGVRAKLRSDFTSGNSALNIRNLNQAIGHLQKMIDEVPNVAGHQIPVIGQTVNSLENSYEQHSGDQGITNYDTAKRALAGELAALFKGKGASSEAEVKGWMDQLSADQSNEQKFGTARTLSELLKSRLDELHQQYKQGMGTTATPFEVLNPLAADSYKRLSVIGQKVFDPSASPQAAQAPTAQADPELDALLKKYGGQ